MIAFPCPCGLHRFEMPDDEAGGLVQCPKCGRLNDVPLLSDLAALEDDGTLKFQDDDEPARPEPNRLAEQMRVYGKSKIDPDGSEIDLRHTFEQVQAIGDAPAAERSGGKKARERGESPKYDPVTGELMRELDIKPVAPRAVIPLATATGPVAAIGPGASASMDQLARRKRSLSYATKAIDLRPIPQLWELPAKLLEPVNLFVMLFVTLGLFMTACVTVPVIGGIFFAAPPMLVGWGLVLAHYANCVEDLGPGQHDELPRPLRNLELGADLWLPFTHMFFCLMVCFVPAIVCSAVTGGAVRFVGTGVLLAVGIALFPALALIFCASGHAANLRPDRVLGTILCLGPGYLILIGLGFLTLLFNGACTVLLALTFLRLLGVGGGTSMGFMIGSAGTTIVSVYLSHLAAWYLGVLYRRRAHEFPWYFEQHERDRAEAKRLTALARIEAARQRNARRG